MSNDIEFENLKDLEKYIMDLSKDILKNEVLETVKDIEEEKIQEQVYDKYRISNSGQKYNPWVYKRRMKDKGLIDRKNTKGKVKKISNNELELEITNVTKGKGNLKGKQIAGLIEYGDGYNGMTYNYKENRDNTSEQYLQPRPFLEQTNKQIINRNTYKKEFIKAMKDKGIDIET